MKEIVPYVVAGLLLLTGFVVPRVAAQGPQDQSTLEQRVGALEAALAEQQQVNKDLHTRLEQTIVYLDKMANSGGLLVGELNQVEELGFTAGINYQSRELMLDALRAHLSAGLEGLPAVTPPPAEEKSNGRVVRRRQ